jgi:hypothetical protein
MPKGPGIEHFDMLVGELVAEGALELEQVEKGDCTAFRFSVTSHCPRAVDLPDEAIEAIKYGVRMVQGRTAAAVSEESHRRSWEKTPNGHEMNIYADISSDEEYARHAESFRRISSIVDKVWGQGSSRYQRSAHCINEPTEQSAFITALRSCWSTKAS